MVDFLRPKALLVANDDILGEPWVVLESHRNTRTPGEKRSNLFKKTTLLLLGLLVASIVVPSMFYGLLSRNGARALLMTAQNSSAAQTATFSLPEATPKITSPAVALSGTKAAISTSYAAASPDKNEIRIDGISVKMPIVEGTDDSVLYKGAWRSPWGSNPTSGGNTVIFGHRFLKLPPSQETFFRLNEVKVGDSIEIDWEGKTYTYRVTETKVVAPDDLSVLEQTAEPRITLITCTPVFSTKSRLIVIAVPI